MWCFIFRWKWRITALDKILSQSRFRVFWDFEISSEILPLSSVKVLCWGGSRLWFIETNSQNLSLENIREARERIHPLIEGPASSSGYRSVWRSLKMTVFQAPRYTIQTLLRDMDPEGTESRRRHRLRRRVYSNPGPNYAWYITGMTSLNLSVLLFMA